ncbi:hypothetical protein L596_011984 [Steinernema carpocapsae]|uniref:HEAT repeat-containing protein 5B n=1 Tax=Steinernema carpocapsae TaxID=34508 RepID=A0A4U5NW17_STECR|nr:hypothetical protein L596_011984 [Steinernema carpocapsae]
MEQSNSLLLNEEALRLCADPKKPVFIYEWLRFLDQILPVTQKVRFGGFLDVGKLERRRRSGSEGMPTETGRAAHAADQQRPGTPTRVLLSKCLAQVFKIADASNLFAVINTCNDSLKSKDDSPNQLAVKLTALNVLGAMYKNLGRLVGRSYDESFGLMSRWLKHADSSCRAEIFNTLAKLVAGLDNAGSSIHKDLTKLCKTYLTDRVLSVRSAAVNCLLALIPEYSLLYTNEVEATCTVCFKALVGSNYEVRRGVAQVLAQLLSLSIEKPKLSVKGAPPAASTSAHPSLTVEGAMNVLSEGFLRGVAGGFLRSGSGATAGGQKEIRVGVALAYVELVNELGSDWLEKNSCFFVKHILEIAAKCGNVAYTNNTAQESEAVFLRRCLLYVFRSTLDVLLSEQAQISVCKHFGALINEYINNFDYNPDPGVERVLGVEAHSSAQATIISLLELSCLVRQIGTTVMPLFVEASGIMEPIFACLLHPVEATRIAAAWCLRCVTLSVPSQATPLIDRCINRLEHMKVCAEAVNGYSLALASLLVGSADSELGIPFCKSKQVFQIAADMLKTAAETRLALVKVQAGWFLVTAVISLGPAHVQPHMARLFTLWSACFPGSVEKAKREAQARGDQFTWACTLEQRSGALGSMHAFIKHCPTVVTDHVLKNIVGPVETALTTLDHLAPLIRTHGVRVRPHMSVLRIRLYTLLNSMSSTRPFEHLTPSLLRELVADVTITDNITSATSSSLIPSLCSSVEGSLLGGWIQETDQATIEHPLFCGELYQPANWICGSSHYDSLSLLNSSTMGESSWPEPLPAATSSVDAAIQVFARLYPIIALKHRLQLTERFLDCMKTSGKLTDRTYAIQLNILGALLSAFKAMGEQKGRLEGETLQNTTKKLVMGCLSSDKILLKCVAAETLGRLANVVGTAQFMGEIAQHSFDILKEVRDEKTRTGHVLALGCLHRYNPSLWLGQHMNMSVSIILALAQDANSRTVQSWAIFSLSLIASSGESTGMFRGYVEPTLSVCLRLLLSTSPTYTDVVQSIGKLIYALIASLGPELQSIGGIESTRSSLFIAYTMMADHGDCSVNAEAMNCVQLLHVFAPRYVDMKKLVTRICTLLTSPHLTLRKAAVSCLHQLLQREAKEVRDHAQNLVPQGMIISQKHLNTEGVKPVLPETGLEGALFGMLDTERDPKLRQHIHESLQFLVQATCATDGLSANSSHSRTSGDSLNYWLSMCKDILASSSNADNVRSTMMIEEGKGDNGDDDEGEGDDEDTLAGNTLAPGGQLERPKLAPRWPTRVFALEIVQRLMSVCESERAHLDLALAKELQMSSGGADYLVLHLSDLVRMSFMGATSDNSNLRLAGLACLQEVINRFSTVPEPEFPGHVILEQFQAQVGAALRPAFVAETPSHVTAAACQVCSTWIGSGVARDLNDLRRVHQLLDSSLSKLKHGSINTQLYSESAATLEKLAILKAWAEVYVVAVEQEDASVNGEQKDEDDSHYGALYGRHESLLSLVIPQLNSLVGYWLAALRDSALLSLPVEFNLQLPSEGGAFYTPESAEACKEYYRTSWPPILLATAMWLNKNNFEIASTNISDTPKKWLTDKRDTRFHLMLGMCVETLSCSRGYSDGDKTVQLCLKTLKSLIGCSWSQLELMKDVRLAIELMNVLHRLILTRDNLQTQLLCADVLMVVLDAAHAAIKAAKNDDVINDNDSNRYTGYSGDEGSLAEGFDAKKSLAFATLEVCLCLLVRQIPQINSAQMKSKANVPLHYRKYARLPMESYELIRHAIQVLVRVPHLCSVDGQLVVLPTVLYLIMGVLRESSRIDSDQLIPDAPPGHVSVAAAASMQALRTLALAIPDKKAGVTEHWATIMRSTLLSLVNLTNHENEQKVDKAVVMLAVAVLITALSPHVVLNSSIFHRICRLLKSCLESDVVQIRQKSLQSMVSIFGRKEICAPFIRELGPSVFAILKPHVIQGPRFASAEDPNPFDELTTDEMTTLKEAVKAMEMIASAAENKKAVSMVSLLVQSLACFLCDDPTNNYRSLGTCARQLHDFGLSKINVIGTAHRDTFRKVLEAHKPVKSRIEAALIHYAARNKQAQQQQMVAAALQRKMSAEKREPQQAKIQLKNFAVS